MGKLKKAGFQFVFCFIVGILVGILIGASLVSMLVSYRLDESYERIVNLENDIEDKNAKLQKLEESINTMNLVLEDIEVFLEFREEKDEIDELEKLEIKEAIEEKYGTLLGKEVKNIDADILSEVVDQRIFKIGDKEYKLKGTKLVLSEVLKIWVEVKLIEK